MYMATVKPNCYVNNKQTISLNDYQMAMLQMLMAQLRPRLGCEGESAAAALRDITSIQAKCSRRLCTKG